MENPTKKIIERIKEDHIIPESSFKLNWKSYAFWFVWSLMIFFGALFFSLILLNFLDFEPRIFHYFGFERILFTLVRTAPYVWILLSVLALVSGFLAIRKTKKGYRYSMLFATSIGVLIISILGITFHMAKINQRIGRGIPGGMPHRFAFPIEDRWSRPDERMLGGEIMQVLPDHIMLINFNGETWDVEYSLDTEMKIDGDLQPGFRIGVIGEKIGEKKFKAQFIHSFPMERPGSKGRMIQGGNKDEKRNPSMPPMDIF